MQSVCVLLVVACASAFTSPRGRRLGGTQAALRSTADDGWVAELDYAAFAADVEELGGRLQRSQGDADVAHLKKIVSWSNAAGLVGVATMGLLPLNPLSIAALSTWTFSRWTMIAHHTCHGGYNRVDAGKFHSRGFALGLNRRLADWCDWMLPEAWSVEHNRLHHYHLGERLDPDLVERNLAELRRREAPLALKYAFVAAMAGVWKWAYYAPNTFKEMRLSEVRRDDGAKKEEDDSTIALTMRSLMWPSSADERRLADMVGPWAFVRRVLAPFAVTRFLVLPAPLLVLGGPETFGYAVLNLVAAEVLTNVHAFVTIVTNHAGDDIYTFDDEVRPKTPSFYVRQVVSSCNFDCGTDRVDFAHGWLNYQIEHHVWPDLSMLQYQKAAPQLEKICEKHRVPYVKNNVFTRLGKTVDIMVGKSSMRPFPTRLEPHSDKAKQ